MVALPSTPEVTAWPRALAASALVTTEQESKLSAAAEAGTGGAGAAVGPVAGALDDELGTEEEDEAQAASKIAAQPAMAEITTGRRRIRAFPAVKRTTLPVGAWADLRRVTHRRIPPFRWPPS